MCCVLGYWSRIVSLMLACVLQHDYLGDNVLATRGLVHSRNAKLLVSDLEFSVLIMPFSYLESHSVSCWWWAQDGRQWLVTSTYIWESEFVDKVKWSWIKTLKACFVQLTKGNLVSFELVISVMQPWSYYWCLIEMDYVILCSFAFKWRENISAFEYCE